MNKLLMKMISLHNRSIASYQKYADATEQARRSYHYMRWIQHQEGFYEAAKKLQAQLRHVR